ncbi:restriction system-associated AAA family ATPase [Leeuwenhoekiella aestuarii]|uniref:Restriction system-associated AAA family ATPase n=1 Tax=Leeuwenhoekiella aestuarii TaxID=2249426 RepID=A0A4Q0NYB3_9FLAO|nr:restriction system-associated AAA family ATPase [Leeuwenhoekiella aestuarii]RXG15965.1 restriction system-associated AAA family ATPase [Leeuwenhoekiella aestuarii]RXG16659.1 restriction system-associated AAA family ATPase [Leeuwenhoekiella aestuarii]
MKLLNLTIQDEFRSLHKGFSIDFHKNFDSMDTFQPFCFAGLNGSGKSNVLEALASIFYHLEFCVSKFRPQNFDKHFKRNISTPDAYTLQYLIGKKNEYPSSTEDLVRVVIIKEKKAPATIYVYTKVTDEVPDLTMPLGQTENNEGAKLYLPDLVVAYSSGENEILSLPFIKNRLINFDKYCEDYKKNEIFGEPESSLIYIDEGMSQAVLLAALLFEDKNTLKPLKKELGILALESFSMQLYNHGIPFKTQKEIVYNPILLHVQDTLEKLKKCATCWNEFDDGIEKDEYTGPFNILKLDFYINDATKTAFRAHFKNSFELFRFFQVLYELNSNIVSKGIKEEVYSSKGFYTKGKLPIAAPNDSVFHFLDYKILKKIKGKTEPKALLLREFSDGEQQFLHTIGICLMLKDRRTLLLLDEPETHFNPSWRAKFIKILNDSIYAGRLKKSPNGDFNVHLLKDVILTSHSPFIISDCMPNNVIFFDRHKETELVEAKSAKELEFNTFGTSVETILDELFDYNQSIGDWSNEELLKIQFDSIKTETDKKELKKKLRVLGPSIEKDLVLAKLNRLELEG